LRKVGRVTSLGKYQLLVELARGGMGVLHLAVVQGSSGFTKLVVLKELPPMLAMKPELVEMFLEEARIAARLNHPNVVQTNDVGSAGERHYLAMEYLEGQSLRTLLRATAGGPRLPLTVHLHILIDALAGLHHVHELTDFGGAPLHVIHRDVSPHNLFLTYAGVTKVVDFGLARASDTQRNTGSGVLRGKLTYMAPEQLRGEALDRRGDVFAVGVMLWEALAGRRIWRGLSEIAIANRISAGDIPKLRDVSPSTPDNLTRICDRALAPEREGRYASARDMQADLEAFLSRRGKHATARGVGTLLSEIFREEQEIARAMIESQLNELRLHGPRAQMLSLVDSESPSQPPRVSRTTAAAASETETMREPLATESRVDPPPLDTFAASLSSLAPTHSSQIPEPPALRLKARVAVAASATLLLSGIAIGAAASTAARGASRASFASTTAPAKNESNVRLSIVTLPTSAHILVDGSRQSDGVFEQRVPCDDRTHTIRIEAEGYVTTTERVVFSESVQLRVALERSLAPK
jgi:eukaryotic-like serine/threonine-protein kinase